MEVMQIYQRSFLKHIDSPNWIFCGCTNSAPHLHTLANIIYQLIGCHTQTQTNALIYLIYKNDICNKMKIKNSDVEERGN